MEEHRGAFEYDWRTRFHLPLSCIPEEMDWGEAWRLYEILSNDPSSHVCAAQVEWDYPQSRADTVAVRQYDLINQALQGSKAKPYPTPWPNEDTKVFKGKRNKRTTEDTKARLQRRREGKTS